MSHLYFLSTDTYICHMVPSYHPLWCDSRLVTVVIAFETPPYLFHYITKWVSSPKSAMMTRGTYPWRPSGYCAICVRFSLAITRFISLCSKRSMPSRGVLLINTFHNTALILTKLESFWNAESLCNTNRLSPNYWGVIFQWLGESLNNEIGCCKLSGK